MSENKAVEAAVEAIEENQVAPAIELMDLAELADLAAKPVYKSNSVRIKLYERTVEEAREYVTFGDQNKIKVEGSMALGMKLGRHLLPLDKIKEKATRLETTPEKAERIIATLKHYIANGMFDEEIAEALAKTKETAEKMAENVQDSFKEDAVEAESSEIAGLDIEEI